MITFTTGNLIKSEAQALVNTVNTIGVMGKGIALQFKRAFPEVFRSYAAACKAGKVQLGKMHIVDLGGLVAGPRFVINFPTKGHWRSKSKLEDIRAGLEDLKRQIQVLQIESISIPPLGCGHGGLHWPEVKELINLVLGDLQNVDIEVYEPKGSPSADEMPSKTERPSMTSGVAALVVSVDRYLDGMLSPVITLIELHKIMYLIQSAGYDLRLDYTKGQYGPYAANLRHVLNRVEGHFLSGFGDAQESPRKELQILSGAVGEASAYLDKLDDKIFGQVLDVVSSVMDGFEDPQGMELLTSVLWVAHESELTLSCDEIVCMVHRWSPRKEKILKPAAIATAAHRLHKYGLIESLNT